ncbi:MAG: hypothetical protein JXX28_12880 [Deltaproteobacteria bacterium]|nr:hypothetical protein [Deltaproteobacteria bacterium]
MDAIRRLPVLLLALSACAPVYAPSSAQLAMLDGVGDVHASAQLGLEGAELHGSAAVSDRVAVRAVGPHF